MESIGRGFFIHKILLVGFLFFGTIQVQGQTCMADFFFSYLDSTTIHIYNHSADYDSVRWSVSEGEIIRQTKETLTISVPGGTTNVCLTIFGADNCSDVICLDIYPGALGDICSLTDCVWPGDANGDRLANNYDLLYIGMGYGLQGPKRAYFPMPHDPMAWTPSHAENWENWVGVTNYKHFDCDGNGVIDENDIAAIRKNYVPDETYQPKSHPNAPPVELVLDEDLFILGQGEMPDSILVSGSIYAGSENNPMQDLYGLAFTVDYDTSEVRLGTAKFSKVSNSFFGESQELIELNTNLDHTELPGRTDYAISRTTHRGANGSGAIATFSLVIEGDIIGGRNINNINLKMSKIRAVDSLGNNLPFDLINDELTVFVVNDNITSTQSPTDDAAVLVYPNPAEDEVRFASIRGEWEWLEIINVQGQRVASQTIQSDQETISLSGLPRGTYWVKAWSRDGSWTSTMLQAQ